MRISPTFCQDYNASIEAEIKETLAKKNAQLEKKRNLKRRLESIAVLNDLKSILESYDMKFNAEKLQKDLESNKEHAQDIEAKKLEAIEKLKSFKENVKIFFSYLKDPLKKL